MRLITIIFVTILASSTTSLLGASLKTELEIPIPHAFVADYQVHFGIIQHACDGANSLVICVDGMRAAHDTVIVDLAARTAETPSKVSGDFIYLVGPPLKDGLIVSTLGLADDGYLIHPNGQFASDLAFPLAEMHRGQGSALATGEWATVLKNNDVEIFAGQHKDGKILPFSDHGLTRPYVLLGPERLLLVGYRGEVMEIQYRRLSTFELVRTDSLGTMRYVGWGSSTLAPKRLDDQHFAFLKNAEWQVASFVKGDILWSMKSSHPAKMLGPEINVKATPVQIPGPPYPQQAFWVDPVESDPPTWALSGADVDSGRNVFVVPANFPLHTDFANCLELEGKWFFVDQGPRGELRRDIQLWPLDGSKTTPTLVATEADLICPLRDGRVVMINPKKSLIIVAKPQLN